MAEINWSAWHKPTVVVVRTADLPPHANFQQAFAI
jgi:hypothetical protein